MLEQQLISLDCNTFTVKHEVKLHEVSAAHTTKLAVVTAPKAVSLVCATKLDL